MFKLTRYFSITSLVAFVVVTILLGSFYRWLAVSDLMTLGEGKNVALTKAFVNSQWPSYASYIRSTSSLSGEALRQHPEQVALREAVLAQMDGLSVVKVKIYNLDGLTVFSTEAAQIGEDKWNNGGFQGALAGQVVSELTYRETFSAFERVIEDRDVFSSYVPIQGSQPDSPIEGVFEIYSDLTPLLDEIGQSQRDAVLGVTLLLTLLYGVLFLIVRYADRTWQQQYEGRRQAEKSLQESEEHHRLIIESLVEGIILQEADGTIKVQNGSVTRLLGLTFAQMMGRHPKPPHWSLVREDGTPFTEEEHPMQVTLRTGQPCSHVRMGVTQADGALRWLSVNTQAMFREEESVPYAVLASFHDITQQLEAERALRESKEFFQQVLDTNPNLIFVKDENGVFQLVNQAVTELYGRSAEEITDRHNVAVHQKTDEANGFDETDQKVIRTRQKVVLEEKFTKPNGNVLWFHTIKTPLVRANGQVQVLGIATEITERKRIEKALEEERQSLAARIAKRTSELSAANAQLARTARLKDEFLANMSHELRTPLNAILGLSEALLEEALGPLNPRQLRSMRTVEESGRHLLSLINDILDISKIEAGKLEIEKTPVSIDGVCQASLQFIRQAAAKKNIRVAFTLENGVSMIYADARRLKQILVNLLTNAVKFTPEGGQVGLDVLIHPAQQNIAFTIWDTGIGIESEDLKRLFRPFVQVESNLSRHYEGTGLGLALVSRLAELHGGSVTVESKVGVGSRFTVTLALETVPQQDYINRHDVTVQPVTTSWNSRRRSRAVLLLAEDNEANIATFSEYLEAKSYDVMVARDGSEAVERALEDQPDLILMDIQMPRVDGLEAIRRIRGNNTLESIPIIALTALAMPGDRDRCLDAGANDYLSKPVSLKGLLKRIEGLLKEHPPQKGEAVRVLAFQE